MRNCACLFPTGDSASMSKYSDLRAELLRRKLVFEDRKFPADDSSIFYKTKELGQNVKWLRPHEVREILGR